MRSKNLYISILLFFTIFLIVFQATVFNERLQNKLIIKYSGEDRIEDHQQILNYIHGKSDLKINMTSEESLHLKDVRSLFLTGKILTILFLILTVILLIKNKKSFSKIINNLLVPSSITLILFAIIFTFQKTSFIIFHKIFFFNGNWQFPYDSFLITLYPEQYFFDIFLKILILFYVLIISIIVLNYFFKNKKRLFKLNK